MNRRTHNLSPEALSALIEASAVINSSLDLQEVLQAIARSAAVVLRSEASSVLLLDRRRNKLVFRAAVGDPSNSLVGEEFDASLGIAGAVVANAEPALVLDVSSDRRFYSGIDAKSKLTTRGLMAAPLIHRGEVLGVVEVLNKIGSEPYTEDDLQLLQIFGNLAASGVSNAQQHESLRKENLGLRQTLASGYNIIGTSKPLQEALQMCRRVAASNATVLLLGETGTGKEVLARFIHDNSPRRDKPLVAVNCAALPETLLESELFGHERGAFTGAVAQKLGRFELAEGGTLFLDEIGDIPLSIQVKLLRVLEEKEFVRVGGTRTIACDVRIIAATNRDLPKAVAEERFREDLFYRLNVFPIELAPLRQRQEDIPLLAEYFARRASKELGTPQPHITDAAMAQLAVYAWPGNIRELQNVIERAVLLADGGEILPLHLPKEITGSSEPALPAADAPTNLWGYEKALIVKALHENNWNQSKAARALGISRDNLRYRIKKYGIQKPQ